MSALSALLADARAAWLRRVGCRRTPRLLAASEHDWQAGLPDELLGKVIAPLWFERALDHEMVAQRVLGRDCAGEPCYCSYQYVLTELCCEDGEIFFEGLVQAEQRSAWRTPDGRWLIRRNLTTADQPEVVRVEFQVSDRMPG